MRSEKANDAASRDVPVVVEAPRPEPARAVAPIAVKGSRSWWKVGRRAGFVLVVFVVCCALELPRARQRRIATAATPPVAAATPVAPTPAAVTPAGTPAKPGTLAVRVSADGVPLVGAEVNISDGSRPNLATAISDLEGVAHFTGLAPGPYEVWARQDTKVSKLARIGELATQPELALELEPGGSVKGVVTADVANPKDATVTLIPIDVDHVMRVAQADATGKFSVSGLPRGHWRVESSATGHVQDGDTVIDVGEAPSDASVRMQKTGVVNGTVVDGNGVPVVNATIVLRRQGEGIAELDARPVVSTRIRWVHPLAGRRVLPPRDDLRFGAARPGSRPAECGAGHCGVDIGWQRGSVIHAAADGEIAIAHIEAQGEAGKAIAIDHGNGLKSYYMHLDDVRPGLEVGQRVRAGDALGAMGSTGFAAGPHLHFAMTQERDGRTWYVDPEPILRHAVVLAEPRSLDPIDAKDARVIASVQAPAASVQEPRSFTTDGNGRFRIVGVAPGSYVAVAFASELAPGSSTGFAVASGAESSDVAIAMHPGVLVAGRVMGRNGPVANATVIAGAGTGESAHKVAATTTSQQGEFSLRALTGSVTLAVTAPGYGTVERVLSLGDGGANVRRREDFTLAIENAQLRGQVLAPDGGPAGIVILRVIDGPTRRQVSTDATGKFTLDHVAAGTYQLQTVSNEYPSIKAIAETDRWTDIRLAAGGSVTAALSDASGPLVGLRVDATGPGGAASATTDTRGVATLKALAPGEWTVRVRAKGYTAAQQSINVRASQVPGELRFELAKTGTLAGVVRDRQGRRVAGAKVSVDGVATQTDADGNFRLSDAPAGTIWLEADLEGAHGAVQISLEPGGERTTVELQIQ